jgi:hypothetical protein
VHQEEATANSGLLTDYEIENLNFRCLICEQDRINIVIKSISARKERFTSSLDLYYQHPQSDRSLRQLIEILKTREESKLGQEARELEQRYANKLTKNESSNGKTALATKTESEASKKKFPIGSCVNHPNSTTHDTSGCNGGKQKKSESSSSEKKSYTKPFELRNCGRCERWNPKRSAFSTHNSSTCTFVLPPPDSKQFPVANLASSESTEKEPRKRKNKSKKPEPASHYAPQQSTTESDGETVDDEHESKKDYIMNNLDEFAKFLNKKPSSKKQRN